MKKIKTNALFITGVVIGFVLVNNSTYGMYIEGEENNYNDGEIHIMSTSIEEGNNNANKTVLYEPQNVYNDKGEVVGQTRGLTVDSVENIYEEFTGTVESIVNGADGISATMIGTNGEKFTATISIIQADFEDDKSLSDIKIGTKLKIYSDTVIGEDSKIVVANKVNILGQQVSENDINFYNNIKTKLDENFLDLEQKYFKKVSDTISKMSQANRKKYLNKYADKLAEGISKIIAQYPQDTVLPEKINNIYMILSLLELDIRINLL